MEEEKFLNEMPRGMATQYSKVIKAAVYKYITENKRVKTPILKHLKELIDAFEYQVLGGMVGLEMFCIWDLEINVDKIKVHLVSVSIDNTNLDDLKVDLKGKASIEVTLLNFNKNYVKFLQTLNKEFPNSEESFTIAANLFLLEVKEQFKSMKESIDKIKERSK